MPDTFFHQTTGPTGRPMTLELPANTDPELVESVRSAMLEIRQRASIASEPANLGFAPYMAFSLGYTMPRHEWLDWAIPFYRPEYDGNLEAGVGPENVFIWVTPDDYLVRQDTRSTDTSTIGMHQRSVERQDYKLAPYDWAGFSTRQQRANWSSMSQRFDFVGLQQSVAASTIEIDLAHQYATYLLDTANYEAGHVVTIGAGNEWDTANGDLRATLGAMVLKVADAAHGRPEDVRVTMSTHAMRAAIQAPDIADKLKYVDRSTLGQITPEAVSAVSGYLFGAQVRAFNPTSVTVTGSGTTRAPLLSDAAIVTYAGTGAPMDGALVPDRLGTRLVGPVRLGYSRLGTARPVIRIPERHDLELYPHTRQEVLADPYNAHKALVLNTSAAI